MPHVTPRFPRAGPAASAPDGGGRGEVGRRFVTGCRSLPPTQPLAGRTAGGGRTDAAPLSSPHAVASDAAPACFCQSHAELLDRLAFGTLLLDFDGRILWRSANAEALLAETEGLTRRDGRVVGVEARDREQLAAALEALRRAVTKGRRPKARLLVTTLDLPEEHSVAALVALPPGGPAAVAMLLCPPLAQRLTGSEAAVMQAFGLTRRESQIAVALGRGDSLADFCDDRGLSLETARWHLRHILGKMNATRQGHAIARLLGSPVALLDSGSDLSG